MKKNRDTTILMVGVAMPLEVMLDLVAEDSFPGMQGYNHQWETIKGIEEASGQPVDLISFPQVSDYPGHAKLYIPGGKWHHEPEASDIYIPVINIFPFKLIHRLIIMFYEMLKWLLNSKGIKNRIIFLYSSQVSQLLVLVIMSFFFKINKFAILTDPPSMELPSENNLRKSLRKLDKLIQGYLLKKMDGLIVLAEGLATDYAQGVPYVVIEGVAPTIREVDVKYNHEESKFILAFAGTLKKEYDIEMLMNSLEYIDDNIELWIFGKGDLDNEVRAFEIKDSRLKYFGFKKPEELRKLLKDVSALISHLPTHGWYTKYKFPSKLLEYMALGKPVISTRYPTIPEEYEPLLFWIEEESSFGIADAIKKLMSIGYEERVNIGKRNREFIMENKSETAQGKRAWSFVLKTMNSQIN